ncbi:MAG: hypothetical protein A3G41_01360 [Elusimicrobia bacterium RIFCSPLOWO2_12_FULL_59_9]|nr:MAG: hypothetical protein A3G41_01360 [Elusimicrobia bacterium RIFCSPLOWO2_12_FULL_59_9]
MPSPKTRKAQEIIAAESGERLDAYLAGRFEGYSRNFWKKMIENGNVEVLGQSQPADFHIAQDMKITIRWPEFSWSDEDLRRWILHEDGQILVLNKPAGLIVHPLGESWLRSPRAALMEPEPNLAGLLLKWRPALAAVERLGLAHRLDKETSGVMVVSLSRKAQASLKAQFESRKIQKIYRAVVWGEVKRDSGVIDAPIGREAHGRLLRVIAMGRQAITEYKVLKRGGPTTAMEIYPQTGRTNQIRVHLTSIGHPVVGDREYSLGEFPEPAKSQRLLLHAWKIEFAHPQSGKTVKFCAPLPKDFEIEKTG